MKRRKKPKKKSSYGLFDETEYTTTKIGEEPYTYTLGEMESCQRQERNFVNHGFK